MSTEAEADVSAADGGGASEVAAEEVGVPARGRLPVVEIFGPTIAGEGHLAGQQTMFVRLGLCDYRCSWCDSMHAVLPERVRELATYMTAAQIVEGVRRQDHPRGAAPWVSLSGGNPAIHDLALLVKMLQEIGYKVNLETQGSIHRSWFADLDALTLSPKPPSSGMADRTDLPLLRRIVGSSGQWPSLSRSEVVVKIVVFDDDDYRWAIDTIAALGPADPRLRHLSVGTWPDDTRESLLERYRWLAERVTTDPTYVAARVTISPQMHVLAWGHRQGV